MLDDVDVKDFTLSSDVHGGGHVEAVVDQFLGSEEVKFELHAHVVVNGGVDIILSEFNFNVFKFNVDLEWLVLAHFLLEKLDMAGKRGGGKSVVLNVEELVELLGVEVELTEVGSEDLVGNTGHGRLSNDELGLVLGVDEMNVVVNDGLSTSFSVVQPFSDNKEVHVSVSDLWVSLWVMSEIKDEVS